MKYGGAFAKQEIIELINYRFLKGIRTENVRPGSFDPALTDEGYRVNGAFLPTLQETVEQAIFRAGGRRLGNDPVLETGVCYVYRLETIILKLQRGMYGYANPKSSSGRIDVHVRLLADGVSGYDYIPEGYSGPLWIMIEPKTFPVIMSPGITLNQVRLCDQDTRLDESRLERYFQANGGMIFDSSQKMSNYKDIVHSDCDGSVILTLGLDSFSVPGYEAVGNGEPIDLTKVNYYDPKVFFRPVECSDHSIILRRDAFYILSTREFVRVHPGFACEMRPMDDRAGELRSHYAGFIDPGWGCGADDLGCGRPLTLEVRSFENNFVARDGQRISKIRFELMKTFPDLHYDQMNPTYGTQSGPKLGKYFKEWK